jgi:hypothetical protein
MSNSGAPQGAKATFLLGLITAIVTLVLLINYVVSQNMINLPK